MNGALDVFAGEARWVAWRSEDRNGKLTKIPYSPHGGKAKADDPATWGFKAQAEVCARRIVNGHGGGIGIQLGDRGGIFLAGIDLDSCIDENNKLLPWAAAILDAIPTYAERSPSGKGVKLFFFVKSEEVRPFLDRIGATSEQWGVRRDVPGFDARNHGPAIEIYFARRYFAVTGDQWTGTPIDIAYPARASLDSLAALIPPAKSAGLNRSNGGDNSRSAAAFHLGLKMRAAGASFEEFCKTARADPETGAWCREKGDAYGGRELRRIWEKANPAVKAHRADGVSLADARPPEFSDEALALNFSTRHADELRFVAEWGKWLQWRGTRWQVDSTLQVFDLARAICRVAAALANDPKHPSLARALAGAGTVASVERLARADRRHAATTDQWDADPWLFIAEGI